MEEQWRVHGTLSRIGSSRHSRIPEARMSRQKPAPNDVGETARPWALSRTQWIWVALVLVSIGLVFYSYELLNAAPPADHWPGYYAADPTTGQLLQPLTGSEPYQTFVLKSWLEAKVPFVPLLALPY